MKLLKTIFPVVLIAVFTINTSRAQDLNTEVAKMHQLYIETINNSNTDNIDKLYTEDASIRNADGTMTNDLKNIKQQYEVTLNSGVYTITLETRDVASLNADYMFVSGTYVLEKTNAPESIFKGEFVNTLKKDSGNWKIYKSYRFPEATNNAAIISSMYDAFSKGNVPAVLAHMDDEIVWYEAESNSLAQGNPYIGPKAVLDNVFTPIIGMYESFSLKDITLHEMNNNEVLATLYYSIMTKDGKTYNVQAAHHWKLKDDKIIAFQQYADTKKLAMSEE